jgi:CubicO group peptidase (beta-lactamase class C family)
MSKMGNGDGESSPSAAAASRRWTSAEIKEFADGFMEERMSRFSIPGAGLAVVADGQVLFTGSYGWADLDRENRSRCRRRSGPWHQ